MIAAELLERRLDLLVERDAGVDDGLEGYTLREAPQGTPSPEPGAPLVELELRYREPRDIGLPELRARVHGRVLLRAIDVVGSVRELLELVGTLHRAQWLPSGAFGELAGAWRCPGALEVKVELITGLYRLEASEGFPELPYYGVYVTRLEELLEVEEDEDKEPIATVDLRWLTADEVRACLEVLRGEGSP
jgi:hypothetical protein